MERTRVEQDYRLQIPRITAEIAGFTPGDEVTLTAVFGRIIVQKAESDKKNGKYDVSEI